MDFNLSKEQELLRDGLTKFLSTRYDLEKSRSAAKTGAGLAAGDLAGVRRGARDPRCNAVPRRSAESAAAQSNSWSSPRRSVMPWWSNRMSTQW